MSGACHYGCITLDAVSMIKRIAFAGLGCALLVSPLVASAQNSVDYPSYCPLLRSALQRSDSDLAKPGRQVTELQHFFSGYYNIDPQVIITGYFGLITRGLVMQFQSETGIPAIGIVGPLTRAKIVEACGGASTPSMNTTVVPSTTIVTPPAGSCTFNGQSVASGASVTAYQSASVSAGQTCSSQTRTCSNGTFSGSYQYASCSVAATAEVVASLSSSSAGSATPPDPQHVDIGEPQLWYDTSADPATCKPFLDIGATPIAFAAAGGGANVQFIANDVSATGPHNFWVKAPLSSSGVLGTFRTDCNSVLNSPQNPAWDKFMGYVWLAGFFKLGGSKIFGAVHNEYYGGGACPSSDFADCFYGAALGSISNDSGASFQFQGASPRHVIAKSTFPYQNVAHKYWFVGYHGVSNIVHGPDGYYYTILAWRNIGTNFVYCPARTNNLEDPASWRAWGGSGYTVNSPAGADCTHVDVPVAPFQITWNTYFNAYIATGTGYKDGSPMGMAYAVSKDLVHWSPSVDLGVYPQWSPRAQTSATDWGNYNYPTLVDPSKLVNTGDPAASSGAVTGQDPYFTYVDRKGDNSATRLYARQLHFSDGIPAPRITSAGLGCDDATCVWVGGSNFTDSCSVKVYSYDMSRQAPGTEVTCQNASVTFRIPPGFQSPSTNVLHGNEIFFNVTNSTGKWSNLRLLNVQPPSFVDGKKRPRGALDVASCTTIEGWSQDEDTPVTPNQVHIYIDGVIAGSATANVYRGDVAAAVGSGAHGFSFALPEKYKDGRVHAVNAWGLDTTIETTNNALLTGSPKTLQCGTLSSTPAPRSPPAVDNHLRPRGALDAADCNTIDGWSQDEDTPDWATEVHFYFDGPFTIGGGSATANVYRPDLCSAISSCNHGFSFVVPAQFKDGRQHTVYAYGIDTTIENTNNAGLPGNPKTFQCATASTSNQNANLANALAALQSALQFFINTFGR